MPTAPATEDQVMTDITGTRSASCIYTYMYIWVFVGFPWGCKEILCGFGFVCLPGSYTAILYGQVSYDYEFSQALAMVHNDLRKMLYLNNQGLQTAHHVTSYQDMYHEKVRLCLHGV